MVRLFLDEDMSLRLVQALNERGIDALSANDGYKGLNDAAQLLSSRSLGRVLVTNNTSDFLLLHQAWITWSSAWNLGEMERHAGMLLIHSAPGFDSQLIADEIRLLLDRMSRASSFENRAISWDVKWGWREE